MAKSLNKVEIASAPSAPRNDGELSLSPTNSSKGLFLKFFSNFLIPCLKISKLISGL